MIAALLIVLAADPASVFRDPASCQQTLPTRVVRSGGAVRVVAWNVRWFPDGAPGKASRRGTDLAWLACALTWLDADIVMLQEVKRLPHAVAALQTVVSAMPGIWSIAVDDCPEPTRQHLAMLYRTDRVRITHVATRGDIDPTSLPRGTAACPGRLRPALTAYVRGQALDFHLAVVHLDSGREARDYDNRRAAWQRLAPLTAAMQTAVADDDIVVVGDFNTMGQRGGDSAAVESSKMSAALLALPLPFRVASSGLVCSQYYRGHATLLDHVLIAATMQEADDAAISVSGVCAALACGHLAAPWVSAVDTLSDHCPVVVDIANHDID